MPRKRNPHEANRWNPLFHERSSMPVEALKNTTGAPAGRGSRRATTRAMRAIFKLLSLRTSPRLSRWVKNSLSIELKFQRPQSYQ